MNKETERLENAVANNLFPSVLNQRPDETTTNKKNKPSSADSFGFNKIGWAIIRDRLFEFKRQFNIFVYFPYSLQQTN